MLQAIACWPMHLTQGCQRPSNLPCNGGYDFAADPNLRGNEASVVWLPKYNPRLPLITSAAPFHIGGPSLVGAKASAARVVFEGTYVELRVLPFANTALLVDIVDEELPIALVLPLDILFQDRVETARRIYRALVRHARLRPASFTAQRQRRLKLVLRALDGDLAGQDYRAIAEGLFSGRVPDSTEWRTHSIRSLTIRLVREGRTLMRGGYLQLLRANRRKR